MAINTPTDARSMLLDKKVLQQKMLEINEQMGVVYDPTATAEKVRQMMLADGIRPEDNILTREILRMRYGDDYDPDKDDLL